MSTRQVQNKYSINAVKYTVIQELEHEWVVGATLNKEICYYLPKNEYVEVDAPKKPEILWERVDVRISAKCDCLVNSTDIHIAYLPPDYRWGLDYDGELVVMRRTMVTKID